MIFAVGALGGKIGTTVILGGNGAQADRPTIGATRQPGLGQHFAPGIDRIAGEGGGDMAAGVDRQDALGIGQSVEG